MTKHAILSASSAHRWLTCTASALLEQEFPDSSSEAAAEGTLAHEMCELKVSNALVKKTVKATFTRKMNALRKHELYQLEMEGYTDAYLDYVFGVYTAFDEAPYIAVEKHVDFSAYVPEGFGTCDCVMIYGNEMDIIDFKYGKGVPVSAENNPQLRLYALGALLEYSMLWGIETITMHIVQPRLNSISTEILTKDELLLWADEVRVTAAEALIGNGVFRPSEEACRFCRAKATCRARAEKNLELAQHDFKKPPVLSDLEVGQILEKAQDLKAWASDLEEYALKTLLAGGSIPGYKAVEGRSNRAFADQDKAFEVLMAGGVEEALLYERKPLTLAKVEKLVGKKDFAEMVGDYVIKPPGKPALAPESDKREAITLRSTAEEDFSKEE